MKQYNIANLYIREKPKCINYRAKTGNNVSEFTHSNWISNFISQILNTNVHFIDIWYTSLTSIHYNLEHGFAIVTENFSPLNPSYITSFVKIQIRSDVTSHTIPGAAYLPCTLNWAKLAWTGHSQPKQMLM